MYLEDVEKTLRNLKNKQTAGLDNVPSFIIKDCANVLAEPLLYLFNLILKTSTFPTVWKVAKICPILKKGDASHIQNYRPISILSNFSKAFESILYKYIYGMVSFMIDTNQHGFMTKRSTVTNLSVFSQYVADEINTNGQVDVIYTDMQKAFDQLDLNILLKKLNVLGFSESLCTLLSSYLLHRKQLVMSHCG